MKHIFRIKKYIKIKPSWVFALASLGLGMALLYSGDAIAQAISLDFGQEGSMTGRVVQMILLLTVLSLAPAILIVMTSFTRIIVVLSLLRNAMGTQQTPPNMVLASLALFLTGFIMAPTFQAAYDAGIEPLMEERLTEVEALTRAAEPFKTFMLANVRDNDLALFLELSEAGIQGADSEEEQLNALQTAQQATRDDTPFTALVPAFMISELRRAFEIGFLIYIPFLVIDMVVASILMSMGMMMLPPIMLSLPFKLIFFVLVDGWNLLAGNLVRSFPPVG